VHPDVAAFVVGEALLEIEQVLIATGQVVHQPVVTTADRHQVAVRPALQVVEAVGAPLTATSLNRSGEESRPVSEDSLATFDWADDDTPVVIDNAAIRYTAASTLVRFDADGFTILREGPVDKAMIEDSLNG